VAVGRRVGWPGRGGVRGGFRLDSEVAAVNIAELRAEVEAIVAHFTERPVIEGHATEEDARWIMRYDRARAELRKAGLL
jgi:hypothetical protein